jgi:hypothetical protein
VLVQGSDAAIVGVGASGEVGLALAPVLELVLSVDGRALGTGLVARSASREALALRDGTIGGAVGLRLVL